METALTAIRGAEIAETERHSALVRVTHWITTAIFLALLVSGIAILIAHPRLCPRLFGNGLQDEAGQRMGLHSSWC